MRKRILFLSFLVAASGTCLAGPPRMPRKSAPPPHEPVVVEREEPVVAKPLHGNVDLPRRRLAATLHPPLAIVRIERGETGAYRVEIGGRRWETSDLAELMNALPPASEHRLDVSALSPKERAAFKETLGRVLVTRDGHAVRVVEEGETLLDRNIRARSLVIHPPELDAGSGKYVQRGELTFANDHRFVVRATSSVRAALQRFFERLWTALMNRRPGEDTLQIARRILREEAQGISQGDLEVGILDAAGNSVLTELFRRRLIDVC